MLNRFKNALYGTSGSSDDSSIVGAYADYKEAVFGKRGIRGALTRSSSFREDLLSEVSRSRASPSEPSNIQRGRSQLLRKPSTIYEADEQHPAGQSAADSPASTSSSESAVAVAAAAASATSGASAQDKRHSSKRAMNNASGTGTVHGAFKVHKFRYTRPEFLQLKTDDEIFVSADHQIRPIILPRDVSRLPWKSGYAECINAGKSATNEDQAAAHQDVALRRDALLNGAGGCGTREPAAGGSSIVDQIPWTYFGLFDGHAGSAVAVAAAAQLHHIISEKLRQVADLLIALEFGELNAEGAATESESEFESESESESDSQSEFESEPNDDDDDGDDDNEGSYCDENENDDGGGDGDCREDHEEEGERLATDEHKHEDEHENQKEKSACCTGAPDEDKFEDCQTSAGQTSAAAASDASPGRRPVSDEPEPMDTTAATTMTATTPTTTPTTKTTTATTELQSPVSEGSPRSENLEGAQLQQRQQKQQQKRQRQRRRRRRRPNEHVLEKPASRRSVCENIVTNSHPTGGAGGGSGGIFEQISWDQLRRALEAPSVPKSAGRRRARVRKPAAEPYEPNDTYLPFMSDIQRCKITPESLIKGALESSFWEMDELIARDKLDYKMPGGCAAIVSLFIMGKLYVCNAGDCRAIVCLSGGDGDDGNEGDGHGTGANNSNNNNNNSNNSQRVVPMSRDFTPVSERQRILRLGMQRPDLLGKEFTHLEFVRRPTRRDLGHQVYYRDAYMTGWSLKEVTYDDLKFPLVWGEGKRSRVLATIGVTRGFGDHELRAQYGSVPIKPFLTPEPEVRVLDLIGREGERELSARDVLVMGTDGLWDVASNEEVARIVERSLTPDNELSRSKYRYISAAQDLIIHSRGTRSDDFNNNAWRMAPSEGSSSNSSSSGGGGTTTTNTTNRFASLDDISAFVIPLRAYHDEYIEWRRARKEMVEKLRATAGPRRNSRDAQLRLSFREIRASMTLKRAATAEAAASSSSSLPSTTTTPRTNSQDQ